MVDYSHRDSNASDKPLYPKNTSMMSSFLYEGYREETPELELTNGVGGGVMEEISGLQSPSMKSKCGYFSYFEINRKGKMVRCTWCIYVSFICATDSLPSNYLFYFRVTFPLNYNLQRAPYFAIEINPVFVIIEIYLFIFNIVTIIICRYLKN